MVTPPIWELHSPPWRKPTSRGGGSFLLQADFHLVHREIFFCPTANFDMLQRFWGGRGVDLVPRPSRTALPPGCWPLGPGWTPRSRSGAWRSGAGWPCATRARRSRRTRCRRGGQHRSCGSALHVPNLPPKFGNQRPFVASASHKFGIPAARAALAHHACGFVSGRIWSHSKKQVPIDGYPLPPQLVGPLAVGVNVAHGSDTPPRRNVVSYVVCLPLPPAPGGRTPHGL